VLEPRLSKRAESPRKYREIMVNYLRKDQRGVHGELLQKRYWWMVRNRSKCKKALFLIRGIGLTVELRSKCI